MRIFLILQFTLIMGLSAANSYSQNVTVNLRNTTLKEAFEILKKQSNYTFWYRSEDVNLNQRVNVNVNNGSIESVLNSLLREQGLSYKIEGRYIVIFKEHSAASNSSYTAPPKKKTRAMVGHVYDSDTNEPLVGVSVLVKGEKSGVITDASGAFQIQVTNKDQLVFSYIGYLSQTLAVGNLGDMDVKMQTDNQLLNEVVVVGAGTQKKVSVTGAITSIKGSDLITPSSSLTTSFAGKLAGVISNTRSGEPGATSSFFIRGIGTFGGRTTPLVLLDDVEISTLELNSLPPESIESFSILKDASATAIYGARGANGVMLITTKRGMRDKKAVVHVTLENSFLKPVNQIKYADGATWMQTYNEATLARNPNASLPYSQEQIDYTRSRINPYVYPDVNWGKVLFKNSTMNQRANINVQGGSSRVTYYMGLQINHDLGMFVEPKNSPLDSNVKIWRYIFQNNIEYKLTSTTTIALRMNTQIGNRKGVNTDPSNVIKQIYKANPISFPAYFPVQEGDRHIRFGSRVYAGNTLYYNPYSYLLDGNWVNNNTSINTSLNLSQDLNAITKGLSASILFNWRSYSESQYTQRCYPYYYRVVDSSWNAAEPDKYELEQIGNPGSDYISQSSISRYQNTIFYLDGRINYNRRFGDHTIGALLMYMMREYRSDVLPSRNQGFSGRFTYDYKNKYLAEINFGYNGTERLAEGHRFELFPAISMGWVVSNESFWSPLSKVVNFLKIRASYGLVGSDETGESAGAAHFLYRNSVSMGSGPSYSTGPGGETTLTGPQIGGYAVENAHWERAKKFDVGMDLKLFQDMDVVIDYFHDKRDRILLQRGSWPVQMGYWNATPWSNIGKVDNKGFDMSVNYKKAITKDLDVDLRFNLTYNKSKYVYVDDPAYPYVWQSKTGKPLNRFNGYIALGLFKDQADIDRSPVQSLNSVVMPGDIKYQDVNGDGYINSEDMVMISPYSGTPRLQYGIGLDLRYKKVDFGVFFTGSSKRSMMTNGIEPFCSSGSEGDHNLFQFIADDHWSVDNPNPNAKWPRMGVTTSQIANNTEDSTFWLRNGRFLRWKTLEIGYTFPHCRIYFSGDNLAVWGPFKTWDPELYWNSYPLQRTLNIGAQLNF